MDEQGLIDAFVGLNDDTIKFLAGKNKELLGKTIKKINSCTDVTSITPQPKDIFNAFRYCQLSQIKIVIIAQDPYPAKGDANGLAFSVDETRSIPASLKKIYECLQHNGNIKQKPTNGNLTAWAKQGILLFNASLTTVIGKSNAHSDIWQEYTDELIRDLSTIKEGLLFLLWGNFAIKKRELIDSTKHKVLTWGHPSPMSPANRDMTNPKNFIYCDHFTEINKVVPINWELVTNIDDTDITLCKQYSVREKVCLIATDGAATSNGKLNCVATYGWCMVNNGLFSSGHGKVNGSEITPTNNRGELMAILDVLNTVMQSEDWNQLSIILISDSTYSINSITEWGKKWKKENDTTKVNTDLIYPIMDIVSELNITFVHIHSHQDKPAKKDDEFKIICWYLNDFADRLCHHNELVD